MTPLLDALAFNPKKVRKSSTPTVSVAEDEPEQVCTAEVFTCGEMRVIWMAWVPGFDNIGIQSSRRVQGGGRLQAWVVRFAVAH